MNTVVKSKSSGFDQGFWRTESIQKSNMFWTVHIQLILIVHVLDLSLPSSNCNLSFLSCPLCAVYFEPSTSSQLKSPFFIETLNDVQSGTSQLICVSRIVPNEKVLNEKTRKGKPSVIILALNNS